MNIKIRKNGMTLMEVLVVLTIIAILIVFGMLSINMARREYAQRKLAPSVYNNLRMVVGEVLARRSVNVGTRTLPSFATGDFCRAVAQVVNGRNFNCAAGTGSFGNGINLRGLNSGNIDVSIKQDAAGNPTFNSDGSPVVGRRLTRVADHFRFQVTTDGQVTPLGATQLLIPVDVVIESVDPVLDRNQVIACVNAVDGTQRAFAGRDSFRIKNSEQLSYSTTLAGGGKSSTTMDSNATNFVTPRFGVDNNGRQVCEYGLACKMKIRSAAENQERSSLNLPIVDTNPIEVPGYRLKQLDEANVLYRGLPYDRALTVKNSLETCQLAVCNCPSLVNPTTPCCARKAIVQSSGVATFQEINRLIEVSLR